MQYIPFRIGQLAAAAAAASVMAGAALYTARQEPASRMISPLCDRTEEWTTQFIHGDITVQFAEGSRRTLAGELGGRPVRFVVQNCETWPDGELQNGVELQGRYVAVCVSEPLGHGYLRQLTGIVDRTTQHPYGFRIISGPWHRGTDRAAHCSEYGLRARRTVLNSGG